MFVQLYSKNIHKFCFGGFLGMNVFHFVQNVVFCVFLISAMQKILVLQYHLNITMHETHTHTITMWDSYEYHVISIWPVDQHTSGPTIAAGSVIVDSTSLTNFIGISPAGNKWHLTIITMRQITHTIVIFYLHVLDHSLSRTRLDFHLTAFCKCS